MKLTAQQLRDMKQVSPIAMLTAYTAPVARALEAAGIPVLLVSDTVGMVEMGFDSTRHITVAQMAYHIGAVRRGAPDTHVIGDLPFNSYTDPSLALENAHALIEAGADSVKLEGAEIEVIAHLVAHGIDVVGHTGLLPQTAQNFKQVGKDEAEAQRIFEESRAIVAAGAFMLALEHIPADLAGCITANVAVPTIGIGAGASCDGQVLVINDAIGLGDYWPPFSRQYAYVGSTITDVARSYMAEVRDGTFVNHVLRMKPARND